MSAALLMAEPALTRTFFVTMYYHFAFLAISIALFGLSASAVLVYLLRHRLAAMETAHLLTRGAAVHAAATLFALACLVRIRVGLNYSPENLALMLAIYALAALTFLSGGAVIALAAPGTHRAGRRHAGAAGPPARHAAPRRYAPPCRDAARHHPVRLGTERRLLRHRRHARRLRRHELGLLDDAPLSRGRVHSRRRNAGNQRFPTYRASDGVNPPRQSAPGSAPDSKRARSDANPEPGTPKRNTEPGTRTGEHGTWNPEPGTGISATLPPPPP